LVLCTYERPDMLERCVRLALRQSEPPAEVVIVDASERWQDSHRRIADLLARERPRAPLSYEPARVRSATHQRNQALALSSAEIVFAIDDDALLYPDCAERIVDVYARDPECRIAAVGAVEVRHPPDEPAPDLPDAGAPGGLAASAREWLERQFHVQRLFVPYERRGRGEAPLPPQWGDRLLATPVLNGFRLTYRREYGLRVGWSELLRYYSLFDDADFCYRLSAHGRIVVALDARVCHLQAKGGRLSRATVDRLRVMNLLALHRIHARRRLSSGLRLSGSFLRLALLYALVDPLRGRLTLPSARAYLRGIALAPRILSRPLEGFEQWYASRQREVVLGAEAARERGAGARRIG
jgi:GT2 family glycosyltransferase